MRFCCGLIFVALAASCRAELVLVSDPQWGTNTVVLDTTTGLYWLDPSLTLDQSYSTVQLELGTGAYAQFSYATTTQLQGLFTDAGITNLTNAESATDYSADLALINLFGATSTESGTVNGLNYTEQDLYANLQNTYGTLTQDPLLGFTLAFEYNAVDPSCGSANCGESSIGNYFGSSTASPTVGNWLVATELTPEPSDMLLTAAGVAVLYAVWRKKRAAIGRRAG